MTARLDAIVQSGYERLEKFYTGDTVAIKSNIYKKPKKEFKEVTEDEIRGMTTLPTEYLSCFSSQRPKTVIEEPKKMYEEIKKIQSPEPSYKVVLKKTENFVTPESSFKENNKKNPKMSLTKAPNQRIILSGLKSREIIEKVLQVTGEKITICVKSKINVIRHAGIILKRHGMESDLV